MKAFKCSECGRLSYSSADLDRQTSSGCPFCKAGKQHMTEEVMKNCDTCVCCGDYVPEGRMVCVRCEKDSHHALDKEENSMKRGKCRGCGAEIVWIQTASGKSMPCDPDPVPYWEKPKAAGKVTRPDGVTVSCEYEGDLNNATGIGYISHFSTCPQAKSFKKK